MPEINGALEIVFECKKNWKLKHTFPCTTVQYMNTGAFHSNIIYIFVIQIQGKGNLYFSSL
jgi:hypothetical protein